MGLSSDLKPLYSSLSRIGIVPFLGTDEFMNLLIENDLDEEWIDLLENTGEKLAIIDYTKSQYEEAFKDFLEAFSHEELGEFVTKLVVEFSDYSDEIVEIKRINTCLRELDIDEDTLKKFRKSIRKTKESKNLVGSDHSENIKSDNSTTALNREKVFIVHGHDHVTKLQLKEFIREDLKLRPIILSD